MADPMPQAHAASSDTASRNANTSTGLNVGFWLTKILTVAILTFMGFVPKLIATENSAPLADKLKDFGGRLAVAGIGVAELLAVILLLIPKTTIAGAALASLLMLGAIGSHVSGVVGFGGEDNMFTMLFVIAVVTFGLSAGHGFLALKRRG